MDIDVELKILATIEQSLGAKKVLNHWEEDQLQEMIEVLMRHFRDQQKTADWFFKVNPFLDDTAPITLIRDGNINKVRSFVKSFFK